MTTAPGLFKIYGSLLTTRYQATEPSCLVDDSSLPPRHGSRGQRAKEERGQGIRQSFVAQENCGLVVQAESLYFCLPASIGLECGR